MALASTLTENAALNGIAGVGSTNQIPYVALHVSTGPGTTGTNENANAGSYARQERYWTGVRREQLRRDPAAAWTAADILHAAKMGVELGRGWKR